jgi:hypothetical protein
LLNKSNLYIISLHAIINVGINNKMIKSFVIIFITMPVY